MRVLPLRPILLAVVCLIMLTGTAMAAKQTASEIVLTDGTVYSDVEFSVDKVYRVIEVHLDDEKQAVSFTKILRIVSPRGNEITADVLGEYYQPTRESEEPAARQTDTPAAAPEGVPTGSEDELPNEDDWKSAEEQKQMPGRQRPYSIGIHLNGSFDIPLTDYYDGVKNGAGFGAALTVPITHNLSLRGIAARTGLQDDIESLLTDATSFVRVVQDDLSLSTWKFYAGLQYTSPTDVGSAGSHLYVYTGLGAISHNYSGSLLVEDRTSGELGMLVLEGETRFSMITGLGFVNMFSRSVGLELGVDLSTLVVDAIDTSSGKDTFGYAYILDFQVGLVLLGR